MQRVPRWWGSAAMSSCPADNERLVEDTLARFGRIDILVSNAAINVDEDVLGLSADGLTRVLQTNFAGPALLTSRVARTMIERQVRGTSCSPRLSTAASSICVPRTAARRPRSRCSYARRRSSSRPTGSAPTRSRRAGSPCAESETDPPRCAARISRHARRCRRAHGISRLRSRRLHHRPDAHGRRRPVPARCQFAAEVREAGLSPFSPTAPHGASYWPTHITRVEGLTGPSSSYVG